VGIERGGTRLYLLLLATQELVIEAFGILPSLFGKASLSSECSWMRAIELVVPKIDETASSDDTPSPTTAIFDEEESYHLYQCLHSLFHPTATDE
jgi:hypothetical protein